MSRINIMRRIPNKVIRQDAEETIKRVAEWFDRNPRQTVCQVELWYGKKLALKKETIAQQINDFVEKILAE